MGNPKRVVYLIGAGATQAEIANKGSVENILMQGVSQRITIKAKEKKELNLDWLPPVKEQDPIKLDLEQLVSLLITNGNSIKKYLQAANSLKQLYRDDIIAILKRTNVLDSPDLALNLLGLHNDSKFKEVETLAGIINLNHDNLFEVASQKIYDGINIEFNFLEDGFKKNTNAPLILKLHGSFNWKSSWPIQLIDLHSYTDTDDDDYIWLPPTTVKEAKEFPYSKLIGKAYELLMDCDILRVVGCSLNQNDWNIINLVFSTQYLKFVHTSNYYDIQLILNPKEAEGIRERYSYLGKIHTISELSDLDDDEGKNPYFKAHEDGMVDFSNTNLGNYFKFWLDKKTEYHRKLNEVAIKKEE
jgi:hypothetical protein